MVGGMSSGCHSSTDNRSAAQRVAGREDCWIRFDDESDNEWPAVGEKGPGYGLSMHTAREHACSSTWPSFGIPTRARFKMTFRGLGEAAVVVAVSARGKR